MNKFLQVANTLSSMYIYTILQALTYSKSKLNFEMFSNFIRENNPQTIKGQLICYYFHYLYLDHDIQNSDYFAVHWS